MHLLRRNRHGSDAKLELVSKGLHYDPARRTVIFLPGRDVADGCDLLHVGSAIKSCERMLGGENSSDKTTDIFCTTYDEPIPDQEFEFYYRDPAHYVSYNASQFVAHVLMPLLNDDGSSVHLSSKLMVGELKERLSHVTFIGHSYGGVFAEQLCNALRKTLDREGYSPLEVDEVVREVVSISVANLAAMDNERVGFRSFAFSGSNDMSAQKALRYYAKQNVPRIDEEDPKTTDEMRRQHAHDVSSAQRKLLRVTGYNDHYSSFKIQPTPAGYLISDRMPLEKQWREVKQGEIVERHMDKQTSELMHMDIRHDFRNHTIPGHDHSAYPSLVRRVLRNAVARQPGTKSSDLFEPVPREEFVGTGNFIFEGAIGGEDLSQKIREGLKQRSDKLR